MSGREVAGRLHPDVDRQQGERGGNELLSAALRGLRGGARVSHEPDHHHAGGGLDQAVGAESDECDRARDDAGSDCDCSLGDMPAKPEPRKQARAPDEPIADGRSNPVAGRHDRQDR
jgi:hypothetical protein